ncbi:GTPase Era involved in 16S rRNA processing [Anoxybacillus voinovskiensis]|uniref:GTPase Era involved in 16S rRNA processing n=1 Tax=Anoxybacteroides voinovskiense TaxID=230470 RepID=A0A840DY75_9BACL|nr:dynamin family protein [Anoxybacillus voinovskiensis]MBB4073966.1 GTPase Era involved in 16S rRNA processing [Anoxybacillus voinovskiensis]GGJ65806.1 GTPase [Anoxybacillus voinovskiensis]
MMQVTQRSSLRPWLEKLTYMHDEWMNKGDVENAKKVRQLLRKVANEEFTIAFCGHFSAGKSSLINELLGEPLLPSSPIPTSANLVKVKAGKEYARVFYKHEPPVEYAAPYDYEQIRSYCKNGDDIEAIEVSRKTTRIPDGVAIMDTPGIDSTDDAHRLATESALHLADVVFYMMDYNHVQSELNFQFTKELTSYGKSLYLIVNQIDKHRDAELPFRSFQQSVQEAFRNWGVSVSRIFFTSLKDRNHPFNELNELVHFLQLLFAERNTRLLNGIEVAAKRLLNDHLAYLESVDAEREAVVNDRLAQLADVQTIEMLQQQQEMLEKHIHETEATFRQELDNVLEHAYIMPFETRELAHAYLQSVQPDFKVGFLFSKAKTEQERAARLAAFYHNLKEKVTSQMEWHVREQLVRFYKQQMLQDPALMNECQSFTVSWNEQLLAELVKKGAGVTGEYVLNYTNDVAAELKKRYRNEALKLFALMFATWKETIEKECQQLALELEKAREKQQLIEEQNARQHYREQTYMHQLSLLAADAPAIKIADSRLAELVSDEILVRTEIARRGEQTQPSVSFQPEEKRPEPSTNSKKAAETIRHLREAADLAKGIPGMNRFIHELTEKAKRLESRTFTVALFGAFSAGKSSFANALMGERILPSSPNPTTATINKIVPPTEAKPHGTVIVQMKTENQLFKDIQYSLRYFQLKAETLQEALLASEQALGKEVGAKEKPHYAFLQAVIHGYEQIKPLLGQTVQIDLDEFPSYVADETKACFVEWMELYYDCALTRQGIVLVDTPGADSINARHTGVAFEYIKNADAVLFVTYYNHAFSKADREFLIQLGRVKDTFAMDKMFFIVNAADLANSKEELATVVAYVKDQLGQFGIRFPRLYAVSSRLALEEKLGERSSNGVLTNSGIQAFEADFARFIMDELTNVAIIEAYAEIKRMHETLVDYIRQSEQSNEEKEAKVKQLSDEQALIRQVVEQLNVESDIQALTQEIAELTYYVKQRLSLRMNDWFKEAFNPAVLRDDNRNIQQALVACLQELIQSVGFDLAQEMRATSLRIERFLTKKAHEQFQLLATAIARIHPMPLSEAQLPPFTTPDFALALETIDYSRFKKALSLYKNAKSFFERDEKRLMKEEIEKQLQQPINEYVSENEQLLLSIYTAQYEQGIRYLAHSLQQQIDDYFAGLLTALTTIIDVPMLQAAAAQLEAILAIGD